ncbi:MAG: GntR family transcriptional regulator [Candidatus Dormibacteria bacterium]
MSIVRRPLRASISDEIQKRIAAGELHAGASLNEPALAEELGVSRTPLREALLTLEHEGLLEARPGQGWIVAPLTANVAAEVYPMVAALEILALQTSLLPKLSTRLPKLTAVNARMLLATHDSFTAQQLDDEWHKLLVADCPNRRLLDTIASLKRVVHRYEYAYMRDTGSVPTSVREHEAIIAALQANDLERATAILQSNWSRAAQILMSWLQGDTPSSPKTSQPSRRSLRPSS